MQLRLVNTDRVARLPSMLVASVVFGLSSFPTWATDSANLVEVLVVTGGHGFEREPFFAMFRDNPHVRYAEARQDKTAVAYERKDLFDYDVIVLFDMVQDITDDQQERFLELTERGIGLVVLHHALVSYQNWPEYERVIGGRYPENQVAKGEVTDELGYQHHVDIPVKITEARHPVTAGISDFGIHDEIYWGFRVGADSVALATTSHPKSGNPIVWARQEARSRVVYIQLGDSPSAYTNPHYRQLLSQSIEWVAKQ